MTAAPLHACEPRLRLRVGREPAALELRPRSAEATGRQGLATFLLVEPISSAAALSSRCDTRDQSPDHAGRVLRAGHHDE
jgi:hypothetical protein